MSTIKARDRKTDQNSDKCMKSGKKSNGLEWKNMHRCFWGIYWQVKRYGAIKCLSALSPLSCFMSKQSDGIDLLLEEWDDKKDGMLEQLWTRGHIHCCSETQDTSWSKCRVSACQDSRTIAGRSPRTARLAGLVSTELWLQADLKIKRTPPKSVQCHLTFTMPDIVHSTWWWRRLLWGPFMLMNGSSQTGNNAGTDHPSSVTSSD